MPEKRKVTNISAAALVYRLAEPFEIFAEFKDNTHPLKLVRNSLCLIGGNWVGESAKSDRGPLDTLKRELSEELTIAKATVSRKELEDLGFDENADPSAEVIAQRGSVDDVRRLNEIRRAIITGFEPFGSYTQFVSREAILSADPEPKQQAFTALANVYTSGLDERTWGDLMRLQTRYGNLIAEFSSSIITSLDDIVEKKMRSAFGYDRILQYFFRTMDLHAKEIPMVQGVEVEFVGPILDTYSEYLARYDVEKKP